jgi:glutaredoxin 3
MGRVTVFTADGCPFCQKAKEVLSSKGAVFQEISLTQTPEWKGLLFILTNGKTSVPEVFFNSTLVGGADDLIKLEGEGKLEGMIKECLEAPDPTAFPPPLRTPNMEEYLQVIPKELQQKWQKGLEALDEKLGGTRERPIDSLLVMLEVPGALVVLCTAGPGAQTFTVGAAAMKGSEDSQDLVYCQVAIDRKITLYVDDPTKMPGLEQTEDWVKFGYNHYLGAPWSVGQVNGTVVAMEKQAGILKEEHKAVVEALRDSVERDLQHYRDTH